MTADARWLGDMPGLYESTLGPVLFEPFAGVMAERVAALQPARVLELAAGTGRLTAALVRALPAAAITATDLNAGMVAYGAQQVPAAHWQPADAQALPFVDEAFDAVVSQFGVMFFPDKPAAFAQTARVLAPGGHTVFAVWDAASTSGYAQALVESVDAVFPDRPPDFITRVPHGYYDAARIRSDVQAGGLTLERIEHVSCNGAAPDARTMARGYCYGTPLRFELEARGPLDELAARVGEEMTARLGSGPVEAESAALIVTARRA